jgi:hypothetical protein
VHLVVQRVAVPPEARVRRGAQLEDHVAGRDAGRLLALALEADLALRRHAALQLRGERLLLHHHLAPVAVGARGLGHVAAPAALAARLLHLHDEAGRHLLLHHAHAAPAARAALLGLAALGTRAAALGADDVAADARRALAAVVQVLQRHLHVHGRVGALAAAALAAAKEHVERAHVAAAAAALLVALQPLEPLEVVHLALLVVAKHLVRAADLLEARGRLGVALVAVGVVLQRQLAVRLLDLVGGGVLRDAQRLRA